MANWPERACTALTVYYERGLRALDCIRREEWDETEVILNMRRAAFHNFRAADHLALQTGYSIDQEEQLRAIWQQISISDNDLLQAMSTARDKMQLELVRLVKVKSTLSRFRSGSVVDSLLEKPV